MKNILSLIFWTVFLTGISHFSSANDEALPLTSESKPTMTIVVASDAPEYTQTAVKDLVHYVREISGAELPVVNSPQNSETPGIIWIGPHPELSRKHPQIDVAFTKPEETLIQTSGKDLILAGNDVVAKSGTQLQAGTYLAVLSFIENQLGVRWLWPGALGTDIPKNTNIRIEPLSVRYTPQLHLRFINMANAGRDYSGLPKAAKKEVRRHINATEWVKLRERETREWLNNHRTDGKPTGKDTNCLAGSMADYRMRHLPYRWYERYGKEHPDWFAQQPDGTRTPYPNKAYAKLCVSNPEVAEEWLRLAKEYFLANPEATTFEASENDRGWEGYCVCENCLALDNKEAEILERNLKWKGIQKPSYALTDRYAKFWNTLAKKLKEAFPDRDVNVSTFAYHVTRPAPTVKLENNIIPTFVGVERRFYNRNSQEHTLEQRKMWEQWWEAVGRQDALIWRPNIMYRNLGLPYIFTKRHAENMHFLADHGLAGIYFGNLGGHWAVQGPQLYLNAKLAWNPKADADEILSDYYKRAFGPAAPYIQEYFQVYEDLYVKLAQQYKGQIYSIYADPPRLFRESRQDSEMATARLGREGIARNHQVEERANALLEKAKNAVANSDKKFQERVEFIDHGFQFIQLQLDSIQAVNDYVNNPSLENKEHADEAVRKRDAFLAENADSYAVNYLNIMREWEGAQPKVLPEPEQKKEEEKLINDLEA